MNEHINRAIALHEKALRILERISVRSRTIQLIHEAVTGSGDLLSTAYRMELIGRLKKIERVSLPLLNDAYNQTVKEIAQ